VKTGPETMGTIKFHFIQKLLQWQGAASATGGFIGREKSNYDWSTAIEAIAWDITRPFFHLQQSFFFQS
jgi:hypothetical protein